MRLLLLFFPNRICLIQDEVPAMARPFPLPGAPQTVLQAEAVCLQPFACRIRRALLAFPIISCNLEHGVPIIRARSAETEATLFKPAVCDENGPLPEESRQ